MNTNRESEDRRRDALAVCKLHDNPFDPDEDPQTSFNFRKQNISLASNLDIFGNAELEPFYFSEKGCFSTLVKEMEGFFRRRGRRIEAASPFVVLISGSDKVGMNSASSYIAHKLGQKLPQRPSFDQVLVQGDDYTAFLALATAKIKRHLLKTEDPAQKQIVLEAFETYEKLIRNAEMSTAVEPTKIQTYYLNLIVDLKTVLPQTAPWLILVVEDITGDRRSWIARSQPAFAAAKVLPIYLSKAPATYTYFKNLLNRDFDGLCVSLTEMDTDSAGDFVRSRIKRFRFGSAQTEDFPFAPTAIAELVSGEKEGVPIKFLIPRLVGALEAKVDKLSEGDPQEAVESEILITYQDIKRSYEKDLPK
jgi:hypothetical protein